MPDISTILTTVKNGIAKQTTTPTIYVPDTTGITDGYVAKYSGGEVVWAADGGGDRCGGLSGLHAETHGAGGRREETGVDTLVSVHPAD